MPAGNESASRSTNVASAPSQASNDASAFARAIEMSSSAAITEREIKIASVLRPLGNGPLTREQAPLAAQLLNVHWTHVYRLRRRFLAAWSRVLWRHTRQAAGLAIALIRASKPSCKSHFTSGCLSKTIWPILCSTYAMKSAGAAQMQTFPSRRATPWPSARHRIVTSSKLCSPSIPSPRRLRAT